MSYGSLGSYSANDTSLNYSLTDRSDEFNTSLTNHGIQVKDSYAYEDPQTNSLVIGLGDAEGDLINAIFSTSNGPGCSILNTYDDEIGWMDLNGVLPISSGTINFKAFDWLRRSILTNLMQLGKVDYEDVSAQSVAGRTQLLVTEAFSVRGDKKISVVTHTTNSRKLSDQELTILGAARRLYSIKSM